MKGTALSALFAAATLLASPVFAAEDLCAINLQKIDDSMATAGATSEGLDKAVTEHIDKAKAAQASGDTKECIAITSKVLERLEKPTKAVVRQAAAAVLEPSRRERGGMLSTPPAQSRILPVRADRYVS